MEVMIKNSVKKTYEQKHCKIQRFFQKEGEDYDNNLFEQTKYTSFSIHGLEFTCKRLFFPVKQVRNKLIPKRDSCMQI
jgi:hypothetical protein